MPIRLLLILSLLVQPLALTAPAPSSAGCACGVASCCEVVERTTCCDETIRERVCSASGGGECLCPDERPAPEREPKAPQTRTGSELVSTILPPQTGTVMPVPDEREQTLPRLAPQERTPRSNTLTRAILGVWRT